MKSFKTLIFALSVSCIAAGGFFVFPNYSKAQSEIKYCDWNGVDCSSPLTDNLCHCDKQGGDPGDPGTGG